MLFFLEAGQHVKPTQGATAQPACPGIAAISLMNGRKNMQACIVINHLSNWRVITHTCSKTSLPNTLTLEWRNISPPPSAVFRCHVSGPPHEYSPRFDLTKTH